MKLVIDLEGKAIDPKISITDLLRTALVVAVKLDMQDYKEWIERELNGYCDVEFENIPQYRFLNGAVKFKNPYYGWCDVIWANQAQQDVFSHYPIKEKISAIENIVQSNGVIYKNLPVEMRQNLAEDNLGMDHKLIFEKSGFVGILDSVRNNILQWALGLEKKGILGEEMVFNEKERQNAKTITVNNIINQVDNSNIQLGMTNSATFSGSENIDAIKTLVEEIKKFLPEIPYEAERNAIKGQIDTIEQQLSNSSPKINVVHEILRSVRNIIEGMGGSILASSPQLLDGFKAIIGQ